VDPVTNVRSCYSDQGSGTKDEAVSKCTAAGGNLPVVLTRAETEYLGLKFPGQEIWIALTSDKYFNVQITKNIIQSRSLNVITLGQAQTDNINRMIIITDLSHIVLSIIWDSVDVIT
jgi:hypothetical protein